MVNVTVSQSTQYVQRSLQCTVHTVPCFSRSNSSFSMALPRRAATSAFSCQQIHHVLRTSANISLHFNGHFPGEPGLAGVYWSKGWWSWWWNLDYWSYKSCKAPVKSSPTNQHPVFLQVGCPSSRPTNSVKALKGKYHIPWTCLPQAHLGVFHLCLWPLIAPGYLDGRLPCLSSALWCQYPPHFSKYAQKNLH